MNPAHIKFPTVYIKYINVGCLLIYMCCGLNCSVIHCIVTAFPFDFND